MNRKKLKHKVKCEFKCFAELGFNNFVFLMSSL